MKKFISLLFACLLTTTVYTMENAHVTDNVNSPNDKTLLSKIAENFKKAFIKLKEINQSEPFITNLGDFIAAKIEYSAFFYSKSFPLHYLLQVRLCEMFIVLFFAKLCSMTVDKPELLDGYLNYYKTQFESKELGLAVNLKIIKNEILSELTTNGLNGVNNNARAFCCECYSMSAQLPNNSLITDNPFLLREIPTDDPCLFSTTLIDFAIKHSDTLMAICDLQYS